MTRSAPAPPEAIVPQAAVEVVGAVAAGDLTSAPGPPVEDVVPGAAVQVRRDRRRRQRSPGRHPPQPGRRPLRRAPRPPRSARRRRRSGRRPRQRTDDHARPRDRPAPSSRSRSRTPRSIPSPSCAIWTASSPEVPVTMTRTVAVSDLGGDEAGSGGTRQHRREAQQAETDSRGERGDLRLARHLCPIHTPSIARTSDPTHPRGPSSVTAPSYPTENLHHSNVAATPSLALRPRPAAAPSIRRGTSRARLRPRRRRMSGRGRTASPGAP